MADSTVMQSGRYKAYPEYKDSGVEWLGKIPSGWSIERIKRMLALKRNLVGAASSEYQLLSLTLKGVIPRDISSGEGKIPASFDTYQEVDKNDLVFCLFDIDETPRTIGLSPSKGMITGAYNVYQTTSKCLPSYAYYYFLYIDLRKGLRPFYTGLRKVVRSETFSNIEMPCPSYEEQKQIASFLDYETAKIDTLIQKQQRLIELLTEKRQAVISHAVTKGLNPDVPMKDSGVEWLGEVPEHWSVTRFNYEIFFQEGPGILAVDFHEEGVPLLRIQNVKTDVVTNDFKTYLSPSKVKSKWNHYRVEEGDLIISCSASTGLVAQVDESTVGAIPYTGLIRLKPLRETICAPYIKLIVQSDLFFRQIENLQTGSTIQHFGPYHLRQMYISLPPIEEQVSIYKGVVKTLNRLDELMEKANSQIELMQERRTALISAAVTGKIDVRDWVKPE